MNKMMKAMREEMENKFQQILAKIDTARLSSIVVVLFVIIIST